MARRIILAMLALISALLAVAVIPLGLLASGRASYAFPGGHYPVGPDPGGTGRGEPG